MRNRRIQAVVVVVALLLAGITGVGSPAAADHGAGLTHDEGAFLDAIGRSSEDVEDFEGFPAGEPITDDVAGISFTTPGEPLYVFKSPTDGAQSLFGGFQRGFTPPRPQLFQGTLAEPAAAVGFSMEAQDPASSPATFRVQFVDGTATDFSISDNDANENTPTYLGYRAAPGKRISGFQLISGFENGSGLAEEIAIDDFVFATAGPEPTAADVIVFGGADPVDGDRDVFLTTPVGGTPQNLTPDHAGLDTDPEVSPDGTKIAFTSTRAGSPDVWVMNIDGTGLVNVTNDPAYDADPTWSPDGEQIAFASDRTGPFQLYVAPSSGGAARQVTNGTTSFFGGGFPTWSPDGTRLAYRSDRTGDMEIWESNLGTVGVDLVERNLTNNPGGEDNTPAYSPDGTQIAFFRANGATGNDLFVMPADGGPATPLLVQPGNDEFPQWSPDGERIVFDNGPSVGEHDIEIVEIASGAVTPVATNGNAPDWWGARDAIGMSLSVDQSSTLPGASIVDPTNIPATAIPLAAQDDVADTPLRSVDIESSPLRSVPLRSVPLRSVPLRSVPLRSVVLSDIPLRSVSVTWESILASTPLRSVPLQTITLEQVLALDPLPPALETLTLAQVDLASTPLRSVSMVSLAMGSTPLRSVPVPGANSDPFVNWCTILEGLGFSCADLGLTADSPILALDIAGVPLRSVPLRSVPLRSVPLRSVDVGALPLRSVPLRSVPLRSVEIGTIPVSALSDASRDDVVTCGTTCPERLRDAQAANAIHPDATLGTLFDAVDPDELPGSLLDLLQGLILASDYPWESLPVERIGVQDFAPSTAPVLTYTAEFTANRAGAGEVSVQLPSGFRLVADSTSELGESDPVLGDATTAGSAITWPVAALTPGTTVTWTFAVRPSLRLADDAGSTLTVDLGGRPAALANQAAVSVYEDFESFPIEFTESVCVSCGSYTVSPGTSAAGYNDTQAGAAPISPNLLVMSHIGTAGDVDFFKVPVPDRGTRLQVRLGSDAPGTDFDVALLNGAEAAPLRSVPLRSVPLRSVPLPDNGLTAEAATDVLSSETLDDIPGTDLESTPLRSVSQNRSSADELIDTISNADPGTGSYYFIQVTAFNGGSSPLPYTLYVKQYEPPPPPECDARTKPTYPAPATNDVIPQGIETLILTSPTRLRAVHGAAADTTMDDLQRLADGPGVAGHVYAIERSGDVQGKLNAFDDLPCDPDTANDVVAAVVDIIDRARTASPALKNIVIVGGDDIVPMARIADYTQLSNESAYTPDAVADDGSHNPISAAFLTQNILSDDPYGDVDPIPWLDHYLYVPDLALGRLIETPADIKAQVDEYLLARGELDPTTALTTGYDFLTDGAEAVDAALAARLPQGAQKLVNDTWTRQNLVDTLFPASGSPDIASVNAHYDHNRSLPAAGNTSGDESDLFTVTDVNDPGVPARSGALLKSILFTMGCHAGLSVPDDYIGAGSADATDWAETYLGTQQKAAVYFANTGFGYGDTVAVALSERLMELFAQRLNGSMTVGQAALYAKQAYFGSLGAYGPYDEKALQEATFYGLPMYRIGSTVVPVEPSPTVVPQGSGEVKTAEVTLDVDLTEFDPNTVGGNSHFTVEGGELSINGSPADHTTGESQVTQYRPIVPRTSTVVTPAGGAVSAKGFLVTELTSTDQFTTPAVARPVVDLSDHEPPPPAGDVAFPASFSNISSYRGPNGPEQRLVLLPGQVFRDAGDPVNASVQRLFTHIKGDVVYADGDDETPPFLTNVSAAIANGTLEIRLSATDIESAVDRVVVMYHDVAVPTGSWGRMELAFNGNEWVGTAAVTGTQIEYFAQARSAGGVGVTTNKGRYYSAPLRLITDPGEPDGDNGFFASPVDVSIVERPLITYALGVDGGAAAPYTGPVTLTADGVHEVVATGDDGSRARITVPVDATPPNVTIAGVVDGARYTGAAPTPTCVATDATSGLAEPCTLTLTQAGDAVRATARATDRAGHVTTRSVQYFLGAFSYQWEGFFSPVNNPTVLNGVKAGAGVPVKFRVKNSSGAIVDSVDAVRSVSSKGIACETAAIDPIEATVNLSGGSVLRYDTLNQHFVFNWKTERTWAGSCRQLTVVLADGTLRTALFKFTK